MSPAEQRATFALATVYGFRMLGLFLVLPVFALYAEHLAGATPLLVGLAIGAYGLTQALLQIPFGMVSDRIGRKPVIVAGLIMFAIGSALAALATDIWLVVIGRALQGSGAVAGVVMALLADLTRESQRTKAMAMIGMTIGLSFTVALMAGPLLDELVGVPGIFWLIAVFAVVGIALVVFVVPTPEHSTVHRDAEVVRGELGDVLRNRDLLRLDFGIFALHAVMTSLFLALPLELRDVARMASVDHWKIYLPALLLAVASMVPFVVLAEKRGHMKGVFLTAIVLLALALAGLYAPGASKLGHPAVGLRLLRRFQHPRGHAPFARFEVRPGDHEGHGYGRLRHGAVRRRLPRRRRRRGGAPAARPRGSVRLWHRRLRALAGGGRRHARAPTAGESAARPLGRWTARRRPRWRPGCSPCRVWRRQWSWRRKASPT